MTNANRTTPRKNPLYAVERAVSCEWARVDSNHRMLTQEDLQSPPFGHLDTRPSVRQLAVLRAKTARKATSRTQTEDLQITNQLLYQLS